MFSTFRSLLQSNLLQTSGGNTKFKKWGLEAEGV